jgi:hypothetical protein
MNVQDYPSLPVNGALDPYLRYKMSAGVLALASDSEDEVGTLANRTLAGDSVGTIIPREKAGVRMAIASKSIAQYATIYAATLGRISDAGTLVRGMALEAASGNGSRIRVLWALASLTGNPARTNLGTDLLDPHYLRLTDMLTHATMVPLGSAAGTPAGDCGLTPGTAGTNSPLIKGEAASGNSKSDAFRFLYPLPIDYVPGGGIKIRIRGNMTGNVNTAQTVSVAAYLAGGDGTVGSNLVTTSAQSLTTSMADYDFVVTPTGLVVGNVLDVLVTLLANDTGGTSNKLAQVGQVAVLHDSQG